MASLYNKEAARSMIESLFDGVVDEGMRFLVCSKSNFAGTWHETTAAGITEALKLAKKTDVYIGVGVRHESPTPNDEGKIGRGLAKDIRGIVGFWADIDVAGPAHKKQNLPPTHDDAIKFANTVFYNVPPSMIIDSGNGIQAWWLLDEAWVFDDENDHKRAETISRRFSATLKIAANVHNWTVDSVFDLSRVFRLAGTVNRKDPKNPKPVTILLDEPRRRWSIDDIDAVVVAEEFMPKAFDGPQPLETVGFITLNPNASPPMSKFSALTNNIPESLESWENKRTDFVDQSPSSYDMSLATYAARAQWDDQDIADLLIAHRRERGHDLKTTNNGAMRLDYYQRTIAKAREGVGQQTTTSNLNSGFSSAPTTSGVHIDDSDKAGILKSASYIFGVPITRFVQFGDGEDASYILELGTGETVTIGSATVLQNQKAWAAKLYPLSRKLFEPLKPKGWVTLINSLGLIVEFEENHESNRFEQVTDLLTAFLQSAMSKNSEEDSVQIRSSQPFMRDGSVHISRSGFDAWAKATQTQKVNIDDVWGALRRMKFKQQTISATLAGKSFSRRYWVSPLDDCGTELGITQRLDTQRDFENEPSDI